MVRWTPTTDQLGAQRVILRATDAHGASVTQAFTVDVQAVNRPTAVTSKPPTLAAAGLLYDYAVRATDPDGDPLAFSLDSGPAGMTIDSGTGRIQWIPTAGQLGLQSVTVRLEDGRGGVGLQSYAVSVLADAPNQPPAITSMPPSTATVGHSYQYAVAAVDPEGQPLTYSLDTPPAGITVDPNTGLIQWTPTAAQVGTQIITVLATDAQGASAFQTFSISVLVNHAPSITSSPVTAATPGTPYRYDIHASDPDGDRLTYALTQAPIGMTIDSSGRITWSPTTADVGTKHLQITVADGRGGSATQAYDIAVQADTQAPKVQLLLSANPAAVGSQVTFVVNATDNVGVAILDLTVNGMHVALDPTGRTTLTMKNVGNISVVATATDTAGNTGTASATLSVIDPSVTNPPTVSFDTPADGTVVTSPTDIIGTVSDSHLLYYTLSIAPVGSDNFTEIARGTTPVSHGVLGQFDPSLLPNDTYDLRLFAVNSGGVKISIDQTISVAGGLKLGNFKLSFNDLSIPVSGIPITVTRTYDSLNAANSEDFGHGWGLEFRNTDLHTSVPKTGDEADLIYNPFQDGTRVYLTLPGGQREGFTFHPTLAPGLRGSFLGIHNPSFTPDAGVTDQLSVPSAELAANSNGTFSSYSDGSPYNPASPLFTGYYVLTTKDGLAYKIDGNTGDLLSVIDANGNTLTFGDAGITNSAGAQVAFARDPQGRITSVTYPAGKQIRYQYDMSGNLTAVTDRDGNTTQFVYAAPRPHYLTQVIDPLGHTGLRTNYDDQGRLVTETDAAGKTIQLSYDPSHSTETVTDQLGNPTVYEYDDRGNIVTQINALGGITKRTYDAANNMLSETDPLGHTKFFSYDSRGNVLTETDALGHVTQHTYQSIHLTSNLGVPLAPFSVEATTTDSLGNTTTNSYDNRGNLQSTTDPSGQVTSFTYDASGNPTSLTDGAAPRPRSSTTTPVTCYSRRMRWVTLPATPTTPMAIS